MTRLRRGVLAAVLALALLAGGTAAAPAGGTAAPGGAAGAAAGDSTGDPSAESVLDLAVRGSRTVNYSGTESVAVHTPRGTQSGTLHVARRDDGRLLMRVETGSSSPGWVLTQRGQERSTMGPVGGTVSHGQSPTTGDIEPQASLHQLLSKYRVLLEGAVHLVGRPAWLLRIMAKANGRTVERWSVDALSGLLLARESYDAEGQVASRVAFTQVREPYAPADEELSAEASPATTWPGHQWFSPPELTSLAHSLEVPDNLPQGYQLRSGTRFLVGQVGVVQLVYSDGLQEVSLFRQPGVLTTSSLPEGATQVQLARGRGYAWQSFPRGAAWQAGSFTYTLVGASAADEVPEMANRLPQGPMHRSLWRRVGHLISWLRHQL